MKIKALIMSAFLSIFMLDAKANEPIAAEHHVTWEVRTKQDGIKHYTPVGFKHSVNNHEHNKIIEEKFKVPAERQKEDSELMKQAPTTHVVTYTIQKGEKGHVAMANKVTHEDPNHENATLFSLSGIAKTQAGLGLPGGGSPLVGVPAGSPVVGFPGAPMMINGAGCSGSMACS